MSEDGGNNEEFNEDREIDKGGEIESKEQEEKDIHNEEPKIENERSFKKDIINKQEQQKTYPIYKEEQAKTFLFSQMKSPHRMQSPHNFIRDKEQLFEAFILFQNFINMNKNIKSNFNVDDTQSKKYNIEKEEKEKKVEVKKEISIIQKDAKDKECEDVRNKDEKEEKEEKGEKNKNNYDEIPIKIINSNFMDLVEKSLANDTGEYPLSPKRKIVKTIHAKKNINISKPSKNDKKYSYYTDFLDKNGKIDEDKISKLSFNKKLMYNSLKSQKQNNTDKSFKGNTHKQNNAKVEDKSNDNLNISNNSSQMKEENEENEKETEEEQKSKEKPIEESKTEEDKKNEELLLEEEIKTNSNIPQPISLNKTNKEELFAEKFQELNNEHKAAKEERQKALKLMAEYEKLQQKLHYDIEELNKKQAEFEEYLDNEKKKLQKERKALIPDQKVFNTLKQQNETLILSARKDKEQIKQLKEQIAKIQIDAKQKDTTSKLTIAKIKKDIEEMNQNSKGEKTTENPNTLLRTTNTKRGLSTTQMANGNKSKNNKINKNNMPLSMEFQTNIKVSSPTNMTSKAEKQKLSSSRTVHKSDINTKNQIAFKDKKSPVSMGTKNKPKNVFISKSEMDIINNNNVIKKEEEENFDFVVPDIYLKNDYILLNTINTNEGKIINIYNDNKREVIFQSGVRKEIFKDGYQKVSFKNGDLKQIFPNGRSVYYFNEAKTVQTTLPDGLQIFKFNTGQIEKHYPDGRKQIILPNGITRNFLKDGIEEGDYSEEVMQVDNDRNINSQ